MVKAKGWFINSYTLGWEKWRQIFNSGSPSMEKHYRWTVPIHRLPAIVKGCFNQKSSGTELWCPSGYQTFFSIHVTELLHVWLGSVLKLEKLGWVQTGFPRCLLWSWSSRHVSMEKWFRENLRYVFARHHKKLVTFIIIFIIFLSVFGAASNQGKARSANK